MSPLDFLKVAITLRVMKADTSPLRQRVHWSFGCFACVPRALPVRIRFRGLAHFRGRKGVRTLFCSQQQSPAPFFVEGARRACKKGVRTLFFTIKES